MSDLVNQIKETAQIMNNLQAESYKNDRAMGIDPESRVRRAVDRELSAENKLKDLCNAAMSLIETWEKRSKKLDDGWDDAPEHDCQQKWLDLSESEALDTCAQELRELISRRK